MKSFKFLSYLGLFAASLAAAAESQISQPGVYWVPVQESAQLQYAVFALPTVEVHRRGDEIRIRYPLPLELTGAENQIEMEGSADRNGKLILSGSNATGECASATELKSCAINYKGLVFDPLRRSEILRQISRSELELRLREQIAAHFCAAGGGEPCGFLSVGY